VRELSGGNWRKVDLVRALLHEPTLVLMDEPTGGLDPKWRRDLMATIRADIAARASCVLWATHLFARLSATAVLSLAQAAAFVIVAALLGTALPVLGSQTPMVLAATVAAALMLGAVGLLLSVHIKQLENFAGTMNFVIFPMYFMSTALYPLWKLEESGAGWVYQVARFNPFTHAVEWMRFALYGKDAGWSPAVVLGTLALCFALATWGYNPQRGFGALTKRGGGPA
jgi:ABC-2 type transport system permease protein